MAAFDQETYQPLEGDIYTLEVRAGRFTIHRYDGQSWQQLGAGHSEQDIQALISRMDYRGRSRGYREYYRPTQQGEAHSAGVVPTPEDTDPRDAWRRLNNRLLVIQTVHPETVKELLIRYDLANEAWFEEHIEGYIYVRFPGDLMSLALWFWLHAAQGCGLIERWIQ